MLSQRRGELARVVIDVCKPSQQRYGPIITWDKTMIPSITERFRPFDNQFSLQIRSIGRRDCSVNTPEGLTPRLNTDSRTLHRSISGWLLNYFAFHLAPSFAPLAIVKLTNHPLCGTSLAHWPTAAYRQKKGLD